jgi:hypothetical protein
MKLETLVEYQRKPALPTPIAHSYRQQFRPQGKYLV